MFASNSLLRARSRVCVARQLDENASYLHLRDWSVSQGIPMHLTGLPQSVLCTGFLEGATVTEHEHVKVKV